MNLFLSSLIGYLIGSLNFSLIFSMLSKKDDIRKYGSKNAGATNIIRVYGKIAGILVLICDFLKGILSIYLCRLLFQNIVYYDYIVGVAVILGHLYPIYFNFKGGKGVATGAGVILTQNYKLLIMVLIIFLLVFSVTKIVSLSSISATILYPISVIILKKCFEPYFFYIILTSILISILILYAHRTNIIRLINKTEKKLSFKNKY